MSQNESPKVKADEAAKPFDINEGANGFRLPSLPENFGAIGIDGYAKAFEAIADDQMSPIVRTARSLGIEPPLYAAAKSGPNLGTPPTAFSYGSMSYMPDNATNGGVIQWPGIAPNALKKVVRENVAPQFIIGMRVDDVLRYAELSTHLWKPGWRIDARDSNDDVSSKVNQAEIKAAQEFLMNSAIDLGVTKARDRDGNFLRGFKGFLAASVRDSLTFDGIALWTNMSNEGKVKAYASLPAGNIRLTTRAGYKGDPKKFAVAIDDGDRVIQAFTRDELTFYVRNPRNDSDSFGYGYAETEIGLRLIKGFQNALDVNVDMFDRSAIATGILTISGSSVTQRQLDLINRLLTNMKKGVSKAWALPVVGLSEGNKLELLDLSRIKGNEVYYKELLNMLAGALCMVYRFPVRRFGYRISGGNHDAQPMPDTGPVAADENDPGLAPLLGHLEALINEYLIWTRWPNLQFRFCGKSPSEDSREFELRSLARTWGERRREVGLEQLEKSTPKNLDWFAELMSMCPVDPSLAGVFQSLAAAFVKAKLGDGSAKDDNKVEATMSSKKDPARSLEHGHESGVRRDSAAEATSAGK